MVSSPQTVLDEFSRYPCHSVCLGLSVIILKQQVTSVSKLIFLSVRTIDQTLRFSGSVRCRIIYAVIKSLNYVYCFLV